MEVRGDTEALKRAHARLQQLYEISKLFTSFDDVEQTVRTLIALVGKSLPLRSFIFIRQTAGRPQIIVWSASESVRIREAKAHARTAYAYLAGQHLGDGGAVRPQRALSAARKRRPPQFVILPLVVDHQSIFGAVQFDPIDRIDKQDLEFLNAVANQLAIAVDRHEKGESRQAQAAARQRGAETRQAVAETSSLRNAQLARENALLYEEAKRAVRAREDVLAIVSHDLRNPLSSILMGAEAVLKHLDDPRASDMNRRALGALQRSARRMDRLIGDLLDVAKIETGRLTIERQPCHAGELVSEIVESLGEVATQKSVNLRAEPGAAADAAVICDRERILQVLSNLVGNAIKFTPAGGAVEVRAEVVPGEVRFSVADTGPGIPPQEAAHLFERYWQARGTARLGSGLGLSIAKGIVEAHGGSIWAESAIGAGSTFFFSLPVARQPASSAPPPAP